MAELFNKDGLILSAAYADTMEKVALPYLAARRTDETVSGYDGKPLFTSRYRADKNAYGSAILVHGFTENGDKYAEIIYSLLQNGFDVLIYDQRGHGRSWRDERLKDDSLVHVARFAEYEKDLEAVLTAMEGKLNKPYSVFCHSMGGAVTALLLEKRQDVIARAALCAPMIAPNRRGMPYWLCKTVTGGLRLIGKGRSRLFLSKPYSERETFEGACSTGKERFEWYSGVKDANPKFHNNGPSYGWMLEALNITRTLLKAGAVEKIACPVKIYSADDDWEVINEYQQRFAARLKQGSIQTVPHSRHEIYRSEDETLFPWWSDVLRFLKGEQA